MSAAGEIVVVARWETTQDRLPAVLSAAAVMREQSLAEPGCLGYEVFQRPDHPEALLLLERYRDEQALALHRASSHYTELVLGRIVPLLTGRGVELLTPRTA